ncbi:leucine-rich repeat receptor-like serine/threonine/tyrosine-protein kinase SOBIR1 [Bidens hawaiensis]|uniref:leucine-rich repeat receptor-like serine/threonine/tyrosine-protein kinase SOBIR1 n=1 Tax=Bidens hawaiensis TaxID=980011 RepID=UPI00404A75C2
MIKPEDLAFLKEDDGVASLPIIGKGACGVVYKTELHESKVKTIAIKKVLETPKDFAKLTDSYTTIIDQKIKQMFPSDEFFRSTYEMGSIMWMRYCEDAEQLIDPKLRGNGCEEQMFLVLDFACSCTLDNPAERPSSRDARKMLTNLSLYASL